MRNDAELTEVLKRHIVLYPKMRMEDAVKLLYQSEFAGGHLITNEAESMKRLTDECASLAESTHSGEEPFEDIGGGFCRLNLRALKSLEIGADTANRFFFETANLANGNTERFEVKLDILLRLCKEGELPFAVEQAEAYISSLKEKNYPPVSHSEEYRSAYAPAYRVVKAAYRDYIEVFKAIDALLKSDSEIVSIAIDGSCGAGKSALASLIHGIYDCNVFHMDDYFLRPGQRTQQRLREAGGNVDYERFASEVIEGIKSREEFTYRRYDCKRQTLGEAILIKPKRLNIIEGSYSMRASLIGFYDLKIYLHIGAEEQSERILKRNGPKIHERFINEWIPLENNYFAEMDIREKADLVFGE